MMQPLGKRLIVRPEKESDVTESGIVTVSGKTPVMRKGEVLAVGAYAYEVKVGDVVLFSPLAYDEIDEDTITMEEQDVFAILKDG